MGTSNLRASLNDGVDDHSGHTPWRRTLAGGTPYGATAGDINGDYPVHHFAGTKCVASSDGVELDYTTSLYASLKRHATNAAINLYENDTITPGTGSGVVVYIDENVSLLQRDPNNDIAAHTCQTIDGTPRSWHFVSSSLKDSYIGFSYDHYSAFNWNPDPCGLTFSLNNDQALFPSDMPAVSSMDLYAFYEPEYHWINLKRRSDSHWHMNATTVPITYTNESTLTPGKGYLVSVDKDLLLQNRGTLNNGTVDFSLDYTLNNAWAGLLGYNLIGNPYQSYLDFNAFATLPANAGLWYDGSKGAEVEPTYAVYDSDMGGYVQYKKGSSRGSKSARGILNMHQGFMIRVASAGMSAHFTNAMRTNNGTTTGIREEQPAYPLINLIVTDDEGVKDFAVLELGRDTDEGAEKLRANDSKGWIYLHHGSDNYGILFRTEVEDYQPLWFEAEEEGSYTLTWETANAEFESLTLIDNITGVMTDMFAHDSYTFEANPDQYSSRFKIVIGDWKDVDEHEAPEPVEGPTFAYQSGNEIIVDGEGRLEIIDVTGRIIVSRDASNASAISTNGMVPGVYILRLTNGKETKTQKIVIE